MKAKIVVSAVLFAASFILEGVATRIFPLTELVEAVVMPKKIV